MSKRIVKIIEFLRTQNGRATRREILRKTHLKSKELEENLNSMEESGALRVEEMTNANGKKTYVYHLQKEA
jgi:DNA-binding HxlR family transcriptional regulator